MATTLFMSPHRSVRAFGVAERIAVPAADGTHFQHEIAQALQRARANGVVSPIVIGAMPFDARQPCSLIVPQETVFFNRGASAMEAPQPQATAQLRSMASTPDEEGFKQGVRQAIEHFGQSNLCKAVLSRVLDVELSGKADAAQIFARLASQNPSGYQFRLPQADGSELVGVSPELLVRKDGTRLFSNPLAGSAKRQSDALQDFSVSAALLDSCKDTYEHRLVTEEMRRVLAPLCSDLDIPLQPSLLSTTTMWHLSTQIGADLKDAALTSLQLACLLHPTPAVCGFPTEPARKLIELIEPFDRGLFAGTVGWCDGQGSGEWAVTIRCGRVHGNRIRLFAGAGIVADSSPDAEWDETEAKLQTMLRALGLQQQDNTPQKEAA